MSKRIYTCLILICLVQACFNPPPEFPEGDVVGYKPVYATDNDASIRLEEARPIVNGGQIYLKGNLLLINETGEGIHLIDNTDPEAPQNRGFLKILGAENMAMKDGILYVNQFMSVLAIDVNDLNNIRVLSEHESILNREDLNAAVPPGTGYYFECADPKKGRVVGWQLTTINNPKCYR